MIMKFVISRVQLLNALNIVSRAVSAKNPRSILTGIKFELNKNGLFLTGSDSDISIVTKIPLEENKETIINIFEEGIIVLSAKFITDIVRKLENDQISFETIEENIVKIKDAVSDFSLICMVSSDYPLIDVGTNGDVLNLATADLKGIIDQTTFAASDKETRPILTGVNFKASGKNLECVATDSYRLARKIVSLGTDANFNVTVPAKTLNEVAHIVENEPNVSISVSDKKVVFKCNRTLISTRVISGAYPDTSKLVPTHFEDTLNTLASNFVSSIDRASLLSVDRSNIVKLLLTPENVEISSKSQEIGSVVEKISTYNYEGERLEISFAAKYVVDAIRAVGSNEITILFNGDMKPFIIKNKNDPSVIQLVLPVRTY